MTSYISPLHWGATHFLNSSRDCCSFSIKDIGVEDVFSLSHCIGFNKSFSIKDIGVKDVFSLSYCIGFNKSSLWAVQHICLQVLYSPTPSNRGTPKKQFSKVPKLPQAPITAPTKKTFLYNFIILKLPKVKPIWERKKITQKILSSSQHNKSNKVNLMWYISK